MKRWLGILIAVVVWGGCIAYMVFAIRLRNGERLALHARSLTVIVADSARIDIVRPPMVVQWITQAGLSPVGRRADSIATQRIEALVAPHPFVRSVNAFGDIRGDVYVVVNQREPMFRVMAERGDDFYYTTDGYAVPVQAHSAHYVVVVTGAVPLPFEAGYCGKVDNVGNNGAQNLHTFTKLVNFVSYITASPLWSSQIEQIVFEGVNRGGVNGGGAYGRGNGYRVRLIPRVGSHTILLGTLDDFESKLARLGVYYERVARSEGWNLWREIDIQYDGQVVGRN